MIDKIRQQGEYAMYKNGCYRLDRFEMLLWGNNHKIKINSPCELISVYKLEIWGEVDGFHMQIWNIVDGKYSLEPTTEEMAKHFGVVMENDKYPSRYNAVLKSEGEIDSIWEVRKPIPGFPFNTEKIVYLKMYGEWL